MAIVLWPANVWTVFSGTHAIASREQKICRQLCQRKSSSLARLLRQRKEPSGRIRYLLDEEEDRLCKVILELFPEHMPELTIAVGTGTRKSVLASRRPLAVSVYR